MEHLSLTQDQWNSMRSHLDACRPQEGCGLLAGTGGSVHRVLPIANRLESPSRFRMDPLEQLRALNWMDDNGLELVGIFHSHPADPEAGVPVRGEPSPTDIAEAAYPVVHVIWSRPAGQWQARGYWIEQGRASEVELWFTDND
jgi:proteasome lid subunit RPN8/RPN11